MKLFKKEPDMQCSGCKELISHKNVKWKPREVDLKTYPDEQISEIANEFDIKKSKSTPNQIFGLSEYEYKGQCPKCDERLSCFWFGHDSLKKNGKKTTFGNDIIFNPKPFSCCKCEKPVNREFQVWYSYRVQEDEKITEYLVTLCSNCNTENGYPFEYNLETGVIE